MATEQDGQDAGAKRVPFSMRVTPQMRDRLKAAAKQSGRSLTQEAELRLERSFEFIDLITMAIEKSASATMKEMERMFVDGCGGPDNYTVAMEIGRMLALLERRAGKEWRTDEDFRHTVEAEILSCIPGIFRRPPAPWGSPQDSDFENHLTLANLGKSAKDMQSDHS